MLTTKNFRSQLLILFLLFGLMAISCTKEDSPNIYPTPVTTVLSGTWELRHLVCTGCAPNTQPDYAPGNGHQWVFEDINFAVKSNNVIKDSGYYQISDVSGGNSVLILNADKNSDITFTVNKDTLKLYFGQLASDGSIETYVKQ